MAGGSQVLALCGLALCLPAGWTPVQASTAPPQQPDRVAVKSPDQTLPLEELAQSRRIDIHALRSPQDRMEGYTGPPAQYEVDAQADVEYGQAAGESLRLDLYAPRGAGGMRPGIVLFHGGGWRDRMGSRYSTAAQAAWFAARGFVAVSAEYRLAPRHRWPAMLDDCQRSIRWLRAHAAQFSVDPNRIASTGSSAGGHLSAMVGLIDTRDNSDEALAGFSSKVNLALPRAVAAVDWSEIPGEDSSQPNAPVEGMLVELFGLPSAQIPEETRAEFTLLPHVSQDDAPFFITHSKNDRLIPLAGVAKLRDALEQAGVEVELDVVDGTGAGHALNMPSEEYSRHDNRLWAFVRKHFRIE